MTKDFHCYVRVIEIGTMEKGGINGTEGEVRGQRSPPSPPPSDWSEGKENEK